VSESISVIREYFLSDSNDPVDVELLDSSRSLLEDGVLDSLRLIELIGFLSERFSVEMRPEEVVPENFKTIETIAAFVDAKLGSAE
jgi:acyl carrier protein